MKVLKSYKIGLVYIGSTESFCYVTVQEFDKTSALNLAASYLKPNSMQTLTVISER
jgi:hypothetical protein